MAIFFADKFSSERSSLRIESGAEFSCADGCSSAEGNKNSRSERNDATIREQELSTTAALSLLVASLRRCEIIVISTERADGVHAIPMEDRATLANATPTDSDCAT